MSFWDQKNEVMGNTLHELVYHAMKQNPTSTAIQTSNGQNISYAGLWMASTKYTETLKSLDLSPDDLVGIALPEGLEYVVGILSILRAGGAYAPIDLGVLLDRQLRCFSSMKAILAYSCGIPRIKQNLSESVKLINADGLTEVIEIVKVHTENAIQPSAEEVGDFGPANESNLAWVHMTSGSTGKFPSLVNSETSTVCITDLSPSRFGKSRSDRALRGC
jgi:acyl-CoA synthetase (AMP-forming)/AMP-acid ligase II